MPLLDRDAVLEAFPTNWCDPLLTGNTKVLPDAPSYSPNDIEKLLLALKKRIASLPTMGEQSTPLFNAREYVRRFPV